MKKLFLLALSAALSLQPAFTQQKVAVLEVRNQGRDARYDYIGAMVMGLLQFDLTRSEGLVLVERNRLDQVLREQELQLSGLINDPAAVSRVGRLASVDILIEGEYVFLGDSLLLTLKSVDVATARASVYSERGGDENLVHKLAAQLVRGLTGNDVALEVPNARSLVSLRDEAPGTVVLFSPLVDAEIHVDGTFYGYTKGDGRLPIEIPLKPGRHTIETQLGRDFGVVEMPAIVFKPWSAVVDVTSNGRHTVRDETRHFNDFIYRMQNLVNESERIETSGFSRTHELSFQDRTGKDIPVRLSVEVKREGIYYTGSLVWTVDGQEKTISLTTANTRDGKTEEALGPVRLNAELKIQYNVPRITYTLQRTDLRPGMHRE